MPPAKKRLISTGLPRLLPRYLLVALVLIYFLFSALYTNQRHLAFETGAFDTGVYIQPLWNFINGRGFAVSIIEDNGPLRWATHVEPILFLIAPLYALWPDPRILFWLQAGALSLAAGPLYGLAVRRLRHEWLALAIVLAYFLMPATQAVTLFDFHAVTLAPLFLLSAIYFLDNALTLRGTSFWLWPQAPISINGALPPVFWLRRPALAYVLAGLFFLLALSTKEDISLHVFMIGLYLLLLRRRWWEGGLLAGVGLVWFYVAFQIIIPAYRVDGGHSIYAAWFETLGSSPLEIALSPITAPDKVLALLFRPGSLPALAMITVPLALLPWAGLPLFALSAPSIAFSLLSQNPTLRQLETWHYAAPMLPFIMLGAIDGLARIVHYATTPRGGEQPQRSSNENLDRSDSPVFKKSVDRRRLLLKTMGLILVGIALVYHFLRGYSPLSLLFEWPTVTPHHQLGRDIAAAIPPEASVLAQAQLIPAVAHRETLGIWSGPLLTNYDYIWLDLSHYKFPNRFDSHGDLVIGMIYEHDFGAVVHTDGYLLLENGAPRESIDEALFTFTRFDHLPAEVQPFQAVFGNQIKLIGVSPEIRRLATSETEPQVLLYFETLRQPPEDYHLFLYLLDETGQVVGATDYPQPSIFWWPTSRWQPGDRQQVRVNTIPWWTGDRRVFGYAIGFSRTNDPWDVASRLPITSLNPTDNLPDIHPLENGTLLPIAVFRRFAGLPYPQPLTNLERGAER